MTDLTVRNAALLRRTPGVPVRRAPHDRNTGGLGDIVMPAMVNPHAILPMILIHDLGEDMNDRLFRYLLSTGRKFAKPKVMHKGTALAARESIHAGVTTFAGMYHSRSRRARSSTPQTNTGRK